MGWEEIICIESTQIAVTKYDFKLSKPQLKNTYRDFVQDILWMKNKQHCSQRHFEVRNSEVVVNTKMNLSYSKYLNYVCILLFAFFIFLCDFSTLFSLILPFFLSSLPAHLISPLILLLHCTLFHVNALQCSPAAFARLAKEYGMSTSSEIAELRKEVSTTIGTPMCAWLCVCMWEREWVRNTITEDPRLVYPSVNPWGITSVRM